MFRNTLVSGVLSVAIGITSMPAIAAPLAPSIPQIDNPAVTQVYCHYGRSAYVSPGYRYGGYYGAGSVRAQSRRVSRRTSRRVSRRR
jgi:hypothetical protein